MGFEITDPQRGVNAFGHLIYQTTSRTANPAQLYTTQPFARLKKSGQSFFQFSNVTTRLHIIKVVTFHTSIFVNKKLSIAL